MEDRCDQIINCKDKSDEKSCSLIVFEDSYNKKVPPFTTDPEDNSVIPVKVNVSTSLMNVLAISEFDHTIDLKLGITLEWYENRVLFHNLKTEEDLNILSDLEVHFVHFATFEVVQKIQHLPIFQVNSLWIPYVIFRNTDGDEAVKVDDDQMTLVAVTRQGHFVRSGPEVADEVTHTFRMVSHNICLD